MASNLPNEVWILILSYVPFEDRIQCVQFVCKRMQSLCNDRLLWKNVDYSSCHRISNESGHNLIELHSTLIHTLKFDGCYWLDENFFAGLPALPNLHSLNILSCRVSAPTLLILVRKFSTLKSLAFSAFRNDLVEFFTLCESSDLKNLSLDKVHINYYPGTFFCSDYSSYFTRFLVPAGKRPHSFSIEFFHYKQSFAKLFSIPSEYTIDYDCEVNLAPRDFSRVFCMGLSFAGFHSPIGANSESSALPRYDLMKIRYLTLPDVISTGHQRHQCTGHSLCPAMLPSLKCLVIPIIGKNECPCYQNLKGQLLYSCNYPQLKCIKLFGQDQELPQQLYARLSVLLNLEELHLNTVKVSLHLLLESIQHLKKLHTLSIFPETDRRASASYQEQKLKLHHAVPNLKTFSLSGENRSCFTVFYEISQLRSLRKLSLFEVFINEEVSQFLIKNESLTSISLTNCNSDVRCFYEVLLDKAIKFLPNIKEIFMQHVYLSYSNTMLENLSRCKMLEKFVANKYIRHSQVCKEDTIPVEDVYHGLVSMSSLCPKLHVFILIGYFPSQWHSQLCKLMESLRERFKQAIVLCGTVHQVTAKMTALQENLIDFSRKSYCHNPFTFPYN